MEEQILNRFAQHIGVLFPFPDSKPMRTAWTEHIFWLQAPLDIFSSSKIQDEYFLAAHGLQFDDFCKIFGFCF